jgi:5'-nucleotidase (lipoprotein e(P4) family)
MRIATWLVFVLVFSSCSQPQKAELVANVEQDFDHQLVDQHYNGLLWFARSAEMRALFYQSFDHAALKLIRNMDGVENPAVVLDIDETVLDNSPYEVDRIMEGIPYASDTWKEWTSKGEAAILPGAKEFLQLADSLGVEIFYISNRKVVEMEGTLKNLVHLNVPNADTAHILLRSDESDKTARRALANANHQVVLYIGDNLTDFSEIYANRDSATLGFDLVDANQTELKEKFIMLPNPMYGEWEKALYGNSYSLSSEEKINSRKRALR